MTSDWSGWIHRAGTLNQQSCRCMSGFERDPDFYERETLSMHSAFGRHCRTSYYDQLRRRQRALCLAVTAALATSLSSGAQAFPAVVPLADLDGMDGFRLDGAGAGDFSGRAVSTAGDVNGDGFDDLLIGASGAEPNGSYSGSSYVVFGTSAKFPSSLILSSLNGTNGFRLDGVAMDDQSGRAVSAAGDLNGDGFDDLLIGAHRADPNGINSGSSYLVFGSNAVFPPVLSLASLDGTTGFRLDGVSPGDLSGYSVNAAGDVNGDGFDDLLIGASNADPNGSESGSSYVVFGNNTDFPPVLALADLDGTTGLRLDGVAANDLSGRAVSSAGDVNGDGFDDVLIGAFGADSNGNFSGSSYLVFGSNAGFPPVMQLASLDGTSGFRLDGVAMGDQSGKAVSAAGDVNGDGFDDLLIGAHRADPNGRYSGSSYVVFGSNAGFSPVLSLASLDGTTGFRLDGVAATDYSGTAVSAAGDVNGDGFDDLLVGASGAGPNGNYSGSSYVVFGSNAGFTPVLQLASLDGTSGFRLDGVAMGDQSGAAVSAAGDVNGDGFDDLVIGANFADQNDTNSGSSYVVLGRVTGLPVLDFDGMKLIDFGEAFLGDIALPQLLTLTNPGTGLVAIDTISIADPAFAITGGSCDPVPIRIPINESCTLELEFTPPDEGFRQAEMIFTSNSVTSPDSIFLQGTGLAAPVVSLLPVPLVFGDIELGAQSIETLIVENTGGGMLEPDAFTIIDAQVGEFSIEMNDCAGGQLAEDEFCGIDIGFAPADSGIRQATLQIDSNAPTSPDFAILRGSNGVVFADGFEIE